jgi:succinate dehydrogenase/fumarate reductase-like Fe-S protein
MAGEEDVVELKEDIRWKEGKPSMAEETPRPIDVNQIREMLDSKKGRMTICLSACAGCTLCAESCFLFRNHDGDPRYMPSYKVLHSLGVLYKKKGKLSRAQLEQMKELVWGNCALCERCYCPLGIDLPNMIAFVRSILRSQGICGAGPSPPDSPEVE